MAQHKNTQRNDGTIQNFRTFSKDPSRQVGHTWHIKASLFADENHELVTSQQPKWGPDEVRHLILFLHVSPHVCLWGMLLNLLILFQDLLSHAAPPPVSTAQTFYNLVSNFTDENYSMGLAWCSHRQLDEEDLGHYQNLSNQTKQKQQQQQHYYNVSVNATEWDALEKIACSQQSFMKTRLLSCINKRGKQAPAHPANPPQPATQPAINPLALLIISSPAYP